MSVVGLIAYRYIAFIYYDITRSYLVFFVSKLEKLLLPCYIASGG